MTWTRNLAFSTWARKKTIFDRIRRRTNAKVFDTTKKTATMKKRVSFDSFKRVNFYFVWSARLCCFPQAPFKCLRKLLFDSLLATNGLNTTAAQKSFEFKSLPIGLRRNCRFAFLSLSRKCFLFWILFFFLSGTRNPLENCSFRVFFFQSLSSFSPISF